MKYEEKEGNRIKFGEMEAGMRRKLILEHPGAGAYCNLGLETGFQRVSEINYWKKYYWPYYSQ